jgi:HlyD family secretion protein
VYSEGVAVSTPDALRPHPNTSVALPPPKRAHRPPRRVLIPFALLLIVAVGIWLARPQPRTGPLVASGTLEVEEVTLAAQAAGRVQELSVDEGSRVADGQLVGRLTDPVLDVQSIQAVADPAQQQLNQAQLSRMQLLAPQAGIVQKRLVHRGEYVAPGTPILTVADPTDLKLTLFVLEPDLARVSVGQTVSIRADGYADAYQGTVRTIANRAEFTPRNVQTAKDRQNLVFAVTVRVPNPDSALKAGLPVDATFD